MKDDEAAAFWLSARALVLNSGSKGPLAIRDTGAVLNGGRRPRKQNAAAENLVPRPPLLLDLISAGFPVLRGPSQNWLRSEE